MPNWLKNQLLRAFHERDKRSVVMLNRVYYKYRRTPHSTDPHSTDPHSAGS